MSNQSTMSMEAELLSAVNKNVQMGIVGIKDIIPINENEKFNNMLQAHLKEYDIILQECEALAKKHSVALEDIPAMAKMSSNMMSKMKTMMDNSPAKLARMMNEGTNKGITEIISAIRKYPEADKEIIELCNKLLKTEENNIEEINRFL